MLVLSALAVARRVWVGETGTATRPPREQYITTGVQRADLFPIRLASGRVESGKRTVIECQLENIAVGVRGQRLTAGGASVLLSVIPEGSVVKRGDVLAVLDSSDYEELLRLQRSHSSAQEPTSCKPTWMWRSPNWRFASSRKGRSVKPTEDFEGKILLARSELERAVDRLNWSRRMNQKGYMPAAVVTSDQFRKDQMALALTATRVRLRIVQEIHGPEDHSRARRRGARGQATLEYQDLRLQRQLDRLATLEKQVTNCTIRAPHDGFVIYANNADRQLFIEPGIARTTNGNNSSFYPT